MSAEKRGEFHVCCSRVLTPSLDAPLLTERCSLAFTKEHHHDPRTPVPTRTEEGSQPLLLADVPPCLWQPQQPAGRSMAMPGYCYITAGVRLTPDRCATAVHHCPNLCKPTPALTRGRAVYAANPCPGPARSVHAVPEGPPAASDGPFGIGLDLGITTYTPPTAASVAIQPRVLPGARLAPAHPLEAGGR